MNTIASTTRSLDDLASALEQAAGLCAGDAAGLREVQTVLAEACRVVESAGDEEWITWRRWSQT